MNGTVNPQGSPVSVHFDFGSTTAYGHSTQPQTIKPTDTATAFLAPISGLAPASTIHCRAVAQTSAPGMIPRDLTANERQSP